MHASQAQSFSSLSHFFVAVGRALPVKRSMLEKIRVAFSAGERFDTDQACCSSGEYEVHRRERAIDDEIALFAARSAAIASATLPGFCEGAELSNHVRLARKIGSLYGHRVDAQYWKTFVTNVVGSPTSWFDASLLGRLLPRSRSASAYASAYALGKVTAAYFANDEAMSTDELRSAFKQAQKEGSALAKQARRQIEEQRALVVKVKPKLDADLARGDLTEAMYM
ncbi:MAG TPA: hypothetical protein VM580_34375, partial [Labilithrix sp.]|nr:hypothetical protein [Labilithrix sp.]